MSYKDLINKMEPFSYSKYKNITSYEKLMIYAAKKLVDKGIPLTLNYLCIATFKLFPDAFCCDEEFKEFPSIDRLNRTYMHLKYVKGKEPYIAGTTRDGYTMTTIGMKIANEVETLICNTKENRSIRAPLVDTHKKGFSKDYNLFINTDEYKKYLQDGIIETKVIWNFYRITPYTQIKTVIEQLKMIKEYAKDEKNDECVIYLNCLLQKMEEIINGK